jgi:3',5'-cyclic AMP phosphodiesterase CpdA
LLRGRKKTAIHALAGYARSVRLAFTSDLHVEQNPEVAKLVAERSLGAGVDVLVIAGDVAGSGTRRAAALEILAQGAPNVALVPGNHDLWCARPGRPGAVVDSRALYLDAIPEACVRAGVVYVPSGPVTLAGVTVVGQTGWYDYSLRDERLGVPLADYERGAHGRLAWSDQHFVHWPGLTRADGRLDDAALTSWMNERLARDLALAPRDRPAVIVTHVLPWAALVAHRPLPWGFVRGFLGARSLGETISSAAVAGLPVAQVISGHTHFARRAHVRARGQRFVARVSPIGYPREHRRMGFADLAAVVTARLGILDLDVPAHVRLRAA